MSKSKQGGSGRAVALQYGPGSGAPVIVASGMGHLAERIVEVAVDSGVPCLLYTSKIGNKKAAWN